ncbi:MAG: cyclic nucleotide-binding domain-containing protein, partial [Anaerolineae bacterium]|nr:cyclic nucleotide-binding domain-containing protein [Anaerolineae bacterium]
MSRTDFLAQSALFAPLSEEQRAGVARRFIQNHYQKDDYLFWEGEPAEWLVFVTEGQVKMIKHSESGRET